MPPVVGTGFWCSGGFCIACNIFLESKELRILIASIVKMVRAWRKPNRRSISRFVLFPKCCKSTLEILGESGGNQRDARSADLSLYGFVSLFCIEFILNLYTAAVKIIALLHVES